MKYVAILAFLAALSYPAAAQQATLQPTTPMVPPAQVDFNAVSQDEQALIAAFRHNDENMGSLVREVSVLRAENKRLNDEVTKIKAVPVPPSPTAATPTPEAPATAAPTPPLPTPSK